MVSLLGCSQAQEKFIKLDQSKADQEKVELATKIASDYFDLLKSGETFDFSEKASKEFSDQMTPEAQKQTYEQLKAGFGDFKSLTYVETWVQKDSKDFEVIRLKGTFENSQDPLEIRVVMDNSKKVIGLWIKPWIDNLNKA